MKKGQISPTTMVVFAITVIVGVIVFGGFESAASTVGLGTSATASVNNVTANTYSGFNIVSVGPIVLAGVIILAILGFLRR